MLVDVALLNSSNNNHKNIVNCNQKSTNIENEAVKRYKLTWDALTDLITLDFLCDKVSSARPTGKCVF